MSRSQGFAHMFRGKLNITRHGDTVTGSFIGNTPKGPVAHVATERVKLTPQQEAQKLFNASNSPEPTLRDFAVAKVALLRTRAGRGVERAAAVVKAFDALALNPSAVATPAATAEAKAAVKGTVNRVMGELMTVAGYFDTRFLVGGKSAAFAQRLARGLLAKDKEAMAKYRDICARAKAGKAAAKDIVYAVRRYIKEHEAATNPPKGVALTETNTMGFDYQALEGFVEERAGDPRVMAGLRVWEAMQGAPTRNRATRTYHHFRENAAAGDFDSAVIAGTVKLMARSEKERRRRRKTRGPFKRREQVVVLGFDFNNFMKDVGKVAGPIAKSLAPVAQFVPFVGPALGPALNVVGDLASGSPAAQRKVNTIKKLADAGNPDAKKDLLALKMAKKIRKGAAIAKTIKRAKAQTAVRVRVPLFKRILISIAPYRAGSRRVGLPVRRRRRA